jgi:hypothetical protein
MSRFGDSARCAVAALALGCLAACGTTLPAGVSSASGTGALPTDLGSSAPTGYLPSATGDQATASGGERGAASGPLTSVPPTSAPGSALSAEGLPVAGRGFDAQHVYVGFPTNNDVNQAAGALGLGALNFGDQNAIIDAVVAAANARGGLLGRQVVAIKHDLRTADLQTDPANAAESTCTALTQDRKVVAVVNVVAAIDVQAFYSCLAKRDTPVMSAGFTSVDDPFLASFAPYLTKLTAASWTKLLPVWVDRLAAQKYFSSWDTVRGAAGAAPVKVGLLYPSVQPQQRVFADLHRRLVARGLTVVPDEQYAVASLQEEGAAMSSAVLRFGAAGVTHVLASDSDVLLFMQAADKQQYHPRYGLTSYLAPAAALQAIVPASQLNGAIGIGWLPVSDVDAAHAPGPVGPGETVCRRVLAKAGVDITDAGARTIAFAECDGVNLVVAAVTSGGGFGGARFKAGRGRAGGSFASALVWRSALSASRADLPGAVRDLVFRNGAFVYSSAAQRPL